MVGRRQQRVKDGGLCGHQFGAGAILPERDVQPAVLTRPEHRPAPHVSRLCWLTQVASLVEKNEAARPGADADHGEPEA